MFYNMITLGEITDMRANTNLCQVRVPIFEAAGGAQFKMWATMMLPPGIHGGYEVNDVVFLTFADNSLNRPVVLGQLYRGNLGTSIDSLGVAGDQLDRATAFSCTDLEATGTNVTLPTTATFKVYNGTVASGDTKTFQALWDEVKTLQTNYNNLLDEHNDLKTRYNELSNKLEDLEDQVDELEGEDKGFFEALEDALTGS
jgi:hypothetical protein